jgi:hypothetical protein
MSRRFVVAFGLATVVLADTAGAQTFSLGLSPRRTGPWTFDVGAQMAQPIGDFSSQIDRAWGIGGSVRYHHHNFPLGARADVAWLNYGNERKTVPLSASVNRVFVDMNTMNNIALATIGPEVMLMQGPVRPYAFAFAGFSYFYTESSAGDDNGGGTFASTTNFDDGGLATGYGGGVRFPIVFRTVEAALDVGGKFTRNGTRSYLRHGACGGGAGLRRGSRGSGRFPSAVNPPAA